MAKRKKQGPKGPGQRTEDSQDRLSTENLVTVDADPRRERSTPETIIPVVGPPVPRVLPGRARARAESLAARQAEASKPCCQNCANSTRPVGKWFRIILSRWPGLLVCANCAAAPGTLMEVLGHRVCRNFRPRWLPPVRVGPLDPPDGDYRYIPLAKGRQALVDPENYEWLRQKKWCVMLLPDGRAYAASHLDGRKVYMHRLIMNAPKGKLVDHSNGNGLDNRRCNLRLCNAAENMCNVRKYSGASRFKGVFQTESGKWQARIGIQSHQLYLGVYADEAEAARARDRWAFALQGRFAWLNFPEDFTNKDPADLEFQTIRDQAEEKRKRWKAKGKKKRSETRRPDRRNDRR